MLSTLLNPTFRHLFAAQIVALVGTGLAIKMVAYVTLAPVVAAIAERLPRRAFLMALDLIRAGVIAFLPFVTEVWQVDVLIFPLLAASAGFTPAFQAVIPDVLKDEDDYANALSLLGLAEDLEQLASPMLAAALLTAFLLPRFLDRMRDRPVMIGGAGLAVVLRLWPADDPEVVPHDHAGLTPDHPHRRAHGTHHSHALMTDDLHRSWPKVAGPSGEPAP